MSKLIHGIDLRAPGGIEALMEFHRARFGNATMEVEGSTVEDSTVTVDDTTAEGDKPATADAVTEDEVTDWKAEAERLKSEVEKWTGFSRKNEDNAKKNLARVKELESKTSQLETDSEAFKNLKVENLNLLKKIVANETGLPEGIIPRMQGSTAEELRADAEELKTMFPATSKKTVRPLSLQGTDESVDIGPKKFKSAKDQIEAIKNNSI